MNRYPWLCDYLDALPGARYDYKEDWTWHRWRVCDKQFAAICRPDAKYAGYGGRTLVNLKCDPLAAEALRGQYAEIAPGFYMDKRTWISVFLDGGVPDALLKALCEASYRLVVEKLPKRARAALDRPESDGTS